MAIERKTGAITQNSAESAAHFEGRVNERRSDLYHYYGKEAADEFHFNQLFEKYKDNEVIANFTELSAALIGNHKKQEKLMEELRRSLLARLDKGLPIGKTKEEFND